MRDIAQAAAEALSRRDPVALCTVIDRGGSTPRGRGAKMLVRGDGSIVGTIGGGAVEHAVRDRALEAMRTGQQERYAVHLTRELAMCCGGRMDVLIDPLLPAPALIIFGAGHVATALASVATAAGFDVWVIDAREEWASPERFPRGTAVYCADPLDVLPSLPFSPGTFVVITTHDHALDESTLERCLSRPWCYLGMIGSRAKAHRILARLQARGASPEQLQRVTCPIGLDLGAEEPGEIAVSVVAELIRTRRRGAVGAVLPLNAQAGFPSEGTGTSVAEPAERPS